MTSFYVVDAGDQKSDMLYAQALAREGAPSASIQQ